MVMARKNRPKRKNYRRKAKPVKVSQPLKLAINKIVNGNIETKYRANTLRNYSESSILTNLTGFSSGITGTGEIYSVIPKINQGDTAFTREGNVVFPKKCRVHLNVVNLQNQISNQDYMVYLFFLECVQVKDFANSSAIPIMQLMDDGNGSHVAWDGTSQTSLYKINSQSFRVIRVVKKRMIWNYPQTAQSVAWDPSMDHHSISVDIPLPNKYTYAGDTAAYPVNHAPFFCAGFINNTKSGDTAPSTQGIMIQGRTEMWFKDA